MDDIDNSSSYREDTLFGGDSTLGSGISIDDLVNSGWDTESAAYIMDHYPEKAQQFMDLMTRIDSTIEDAESLLGGTSLIDDFLKKHNPYNQEPLALKESESGENKLGSCDCRSECAYTTGKTWKYADWGYSS